MAKGAYPEALQRVVAALSRWPGVGEKTAARLALFLLRAPDTEVTELVQALADLKEKVHLCRHYTLRTRSSAPLCANPARQAGVLMVVADPGDLLAIEKVGWYQGRYHVLGGVLSPLEGVGPDDLHINELLERVTAESITEVILALNPSLEGETTTTYLSQELKPLGVKVSRIAYGLPMGGTYKYAKDRDTLREALNYRVET